MLLECFVLFNLLINCIVANQEFLGCGGFIKSDVPVNYNVIEVKLYTKQGSLKYQSDCAPNNGYYLIPVYDKGTYVLKVEAPPGWTFQPESYELNIDGENDKCSKNEDINFQFTGFGIVGQVLSYGQKTGPLGVTVHLTRPTDKEPFRSVVTQEQGKYIFEKVLPGNYFIDIDHPTWTFDKSHTDVKVVRETSDAGQSLVVYGFDVRGTVVSESHPIKGVGDVNFVLFSKEFKSEHIRHCQFNLKDLKGFKKPDGEAGDPICFVQSDKEGSFTFPGLPIGNYKLVPFYKSANVQFDVRPKVLEFRLGHDSLVLTKNFQVTGFSVSGNVLMSVKGQGVPEAEIWINGAIRSRANKNGVYRLEDMQSGTYRIKAHAEKLQFEEVDVNISPMSPGLPDLVAARYQTCGRVIVDKPPTGLEAKASRLVGVVGLGKTNFDPVDLSTHVDGEFCTFLASGKYKFQIKLSDAELKGGLRLVPDEVEVEVKTKPQYHIRFSQFLASLSGKLSCKEDCGAIKMKLSPLSSGGMVREAIVTNQQNSATFQYKDVVPGRYNLSLIKQDWCWEPTHIVNEVSDRNIGEEKNLFQHRGYTLTISSTHDLKLFYNAPGSKPKSNPSVLDVPKDVSQHCLSTGGVYKLRPESCHEFDQKEYEFDTARPALLVLTAVRHRAEGRIVSKVQRNNVKIHVGSSHTEKEEVIEAKPSKQPDGTFHYNFQYFAKDREEIRVTPRSPDLLFYPSSRNAIISGGHCPGLVVEFEGREGLFIDGSVIPSLTGVRISISAKNESNVIIAEATTDQQGKYRVGPLHSSVDYAVEAEKEGYILTPESGKLGSFKAFKLGQVQVQVEDTSGEALGGVLLSLSGGINYRNNNFTHSNGSMIFNSLSPGKFYLRPMMKEYRFEPASRMIDMVEGGSLSVRIVGTRVAFSAIGVVTSLNGEPEPDLVLEAVGRGAADCKALQEEAKTERDGAFRIRGLQPSCEYAIGLKQNEAANEHVERVSPPTIMVKAAHANTEGLRLYAFRHSLQLDLSCSVTTKAQFLSSLKVKLYREPQIDSAIHSVSLTTPFFYLPAMTTDGKTYTLRLDSHLSRHTYDYNLDEVTFVANTSYRHVAFVFEPKLRVVEQELNKSSFMVVPLTILVLLVAYYHQQLFPLFVSFSALVQDFIAHQRARGATGHSSPIGHDIPLEAQYPDLLQGSPATKKKKSRKT